MPLSWLHSDPLLGQWAHGPSGARLSCTCFLFFSIGLDAIPLATPNVPSSQCLRRLHNVLQTSVLRKQSIIFWRLILGGEGLISIQFQRPFPSSHPQSDLQVKTPFSRLEEMCLPSTSTPGDERKYEEGTLSNLLGQNTMDDREKECYIWVPGSLCCTAQVDTMSISSTLIKLKKNSCLLRKKIKAKADTLTWKPASLVLDVSQVI